MNRKAKAAEFLDATYPITVIGRNVSVTEPMKNYAMEKISKIDRFNTRITDVNIIMDIQKMEHRCEVVIKMDHILVRCQAATDNMYASIDKVADRVQAQLRKYRKRIRDHQAKSVRDMEEMRVNVVRSPTEEELEQEIIDEVGSSEEDEVEKYRPHTIVNNEKIAVKTLRKDEAIMKMELSGEPFLIFRNEEDMKLKIIYRLDDGNYGIVEPQI